MLRLLEQSFHAWSQVLRLGGWGEAGNHVAGAVDEELGEIPLDPSRTEEPGFDLSQEAIERGALEPFTSIFENMGKVTP